MKATLDNNHKIIALHGFLGSPKDFKSLKLNNLYAPYLYAMTTSSLEHWVNNFDQFVKNNCVLMGYSLGGRLALHALLKSPHKYKAAIIIAAHPGLKYEHDRIERLKTDYIRSRWFLEHDFDYALNLWNSLAIFKDSQTLKISKNEVCTKTLALMLNNFSLGKQEYLVPKINKLSLPILWLCPYSERSNVAEVKLCHSLSKIIFVNYSHRLLQNFKEISTYCENFLSKI